MQKIYDLTPTAPDYRIDWQKIERSSFGIFLEKMKEIEQSERWHKEGNVYIHTKMVCESLVSSLGYRRLDQRRQSEVFLACLLHDVGKIVSTRLDEGVWTSKGHSFSGTHIAREFLWTELDLCGSLDKIIFRETVCLLIRYHSSPVHIFDREDPERKIVEIASNGEIYTDFNLSLLCLLVEADLKGRIHDNMDESLEPLYMTIEIAKELNCFENPYIYKDKFSEFAYLSGRNVGLGQDLYNDTFGEVILTCGLPASGKDYIINEKYSSYPMVSLDNIRRELKISPTDNQGLVIQTAKERAKEYLRKKQPFVWNATNITTDVRGKLIDTFIDYKAYVKIEYVETSFKEQLKRNKSRQYTVPEGVILKMLSKIVLPERKEAHEIIINENL